MRLTAVVYSTHIGNAFRQVWKVQQKRKILEYGVKEKLEAKGLQVVDAVDFLNLKRPVPSILPKLKSQPDEKLIDDFLLPKSLKKDHTHPDWHDEPGHVYHDHCWLLTGLHEAQHISKTFVSNNLPDRITSFKSKLPEEVHKQVQQAILNAHVLDALQVKLPKDIDIKRPGWNYPRVYGLPRWRRNVQLISKMFHTADSTLAGQNIDATQQQFTSQIMIRALLTLEGRPSVFEARQNTLVFGKKPLQPYLDGEVKAEQLSKPLPDIYPLNRTISLHGKNIYRMEHKFPVRQGAPFDRLTMGVFYINKPFIKTSGTQLEARLLLHAFTVAAAHAQQLYGKDVKDLPEPVTINCMQTDSRNFYFACFQLHSLDLDSSKATSNLFWIEDAQPMFTKCDYVDNQPVLEGYNPQVLETLMALYKSQMAAAV
ncbi:hypothetical protein DAPPUDRAFT_301877 [Daphnia pulex]|uniref:Large ribosomal subunit protein mL37 n=1 Tax=Daphnia pulex TaxID=6669 RepID=E9GB26_DAPPU|nr:hypothetical protein DAPPUDRAFT_301877 [Daphnia pulex]|eukprot:EFX83442.1 hypothetical protein DAPPUDRAFT_301877 [Daphnia pulex]